MGRPSERKRRSVVWTVQEVQTLLAHLAGTEALVALRGCRQAVFKLFWQIPSAVWSFAAIKMILSGDWAGPSAGAPALVRRRRS